MTPFTRHRGIAVPLRVDDMNTDVIIPTQRAIHVPRGQLGPHAFEPLRHDATGAPRPDFPLNMARYAGASILVAGRNFGCGSSREMAVWALMDAGFRCVIAPGFGDIFLQNCAKTGLLPLELPEDRVAALMTALEGAEVPRMTVDLDRLTLTGPDDRSVEFAIDPALRQIFLLGLDDISQTLRHLPAIRDFIAADRLARPWIHLPAIADKGPAVD